MLFCALETARCRRQTSRSLWDVPTRPTATPAPPVGTLSAFPAIRIESSAACDHSQVARPLLSLSRERVSAPSASRRRVLLHPAAGTSL
eukprot:5962310-Pleurochrysis_carterae.AAC.7